MPQTRNKDLLLELLSRAVNKCYADDACLIQRSMERASVSRIFLYMYELIQNDPRFKIFKEYDLDCEYNKNGEQIKWTPRCRKGTFPDLILHKRKGNKCNLLVVEFKSATGKFRYFDETTHKTKDKKENATDKEVDFVKLEDFTSPTTYNYFLGVFVRLTEQTPQFQYFRKGRKIPMEELTHD